MANLCMNMARFSIPHDFEVTEGERMLDILNDAFLSLKQNSQDCGYDIRNFVIGEFAEVSKDSFTPLFNVKIINGDNSELQVSFETNWNPCPEVIEEVSAYLNLDYSMHWYELGEQVIGASKYDHANKSDYLENVDFKEVSHFIEGQEDIDYDGLEDYLLNKSINL